MGKEIGTAKGEIFAITAKRQDNGNAWRKQYDAANKAEGWLKSVGVNDSGASSAKSSVQKDVPEIISTLTTGVIHGIQGITSLAFGLLASVPRLGGTLEVERAPRLAEIPGTVPSLKEAIPGCPFEARCSFATDICRREMPEFAEKEPGHFAACFHSERVAEA